MEGADAPLLVRRQPPVPAFADPAAVDRRRMKACPAVPLGRPVAVTVVVMLAEAALPPSGIFGDAGWWTRRVDHPFRLRQQTLAFGAVGTGPLDVDLVAVFANGDVHRPRDAGEVHVDLHLRPMLRLRTADAVLFQYRERLQPVGLELDDVPGSRRLEEADGNRIE